MTFALSNLTIDTANFTHFTTLAEPFLAIEVLADEDDTNIIITASDLTTLWESVKKFRDRDNGESTWILIAPDEQAWIAPGKNFPVEEWFPAWAKTCQLLAEANHYTVDEYNIALRRIPLWVNR